MIMMMFTYKVLKEGKIYTGLRRKLFKEQF